MAKVQSFVSLSSSRWSPVPVIDTRGKKNPIALDVQSFSSGPVDIPIVYSRDILKSPTQFPNDVVPTIESSRFSPGLLTPAVTTNVPDPSPHSYTGGDSSWEARRPPSVNDAALALVDLRALLKPRNTAIQSDNVLRTRLDHLDRFLAIYTAGKGWTEAADYTATILGRGVGCSRQLRAWGKDFIRDRSMLPYHNYANSGCHSSTTTILSRSFGLISLTLG